MIAGCNSSARAQAYKTSIQLAKTRLLSRQFLRVKVCQENSRGECLWHCYTDAIWTWLLPHCFERE